MPDPAVLALQIPARMAVTRAQNLAALVGNSYVTEYLDDAYVVLGMHLVSRAELGEVMRGAAQARAKGPATFTGSGPQHGADGEHVPSLPDTIVRFHPAERLLHWAIAIPFLGCLASAVVLIVVYNPVLVIYNPDPTRAYRFVFAWIHRACGSCLLVLPALVLLQSRRQVQIYCDNLRQAWIWRRDDIKWLVLMAPANFSTRVILPDQGKFNAAEKLNFMMVTVFCPLLIVSGTLIWFPETTRLGSFAPWIVHCALVAIATPLLLGHMFMATINPGTRVGLMGMITGAVSREWAAHHYARRFREQFPELAEDHVLTRGDAAITPRPIACATAFEESPLKGASGLRLAAEDAGEDLPGVLAEYDIEDVTAVDAAPVPAEGLSSGAVG